MGAGDPSTHSVSKFPLDLEYQAISSHASIFFQIGVVNAVNALIHCICVAGVNLAAVRAPLLAQNNGKQHLTVTTLLGICRWQENFLKKKNRSVASTQT